LPGLHHPALYQARSAVDCELDFLTRKNEPIVGRGGGRFVAGLCVAGMVVVLFRRSGRLMQEAGLLQRLLALALAFRLKLGELFAIFLDGAGDALLV